MRKIFFVFLLVRNFKSLREKVVKKINGLEKKGRGRDNENVPCRKSYVLPKPRLFIPT